jgi:hypothetical protein
MSHGEVLPDNTDEARMRDAREAPAEDTPPEARMATTPGEPGLSKVPSITQAMLRDDPDAEAEPEPEP